MLETGFMASIGVFIGLVVINSLVFGATEVLGGDIRSAQIGFGMALFCLGGMSFLFNVIQVPNGVFLLFVGGGMVLVTLVMMTDTAVHQVKSAHSYVSNRFGD